MPKPSVSPEFDIRSQALLERAEKWIESRPTQASSLAKYLAIAICFPLSMMSSPFVALLKPLFSASAPAASAAGVAVSQTMKTTLRATQIGLELECFVLLGMVYYPLVLKVTKVCIGWVERKFKWQWLAKVDF